MEFIFTEGCGFDKYSEEILNMLTNADNEFVPPLSSRSSTTQKGFEEQVKGDGIKLYFEEMKKQKFVIAVENDKVLGFVCYKENLINDYVKNTPNIYISTLIVSPSSRGKGMTKRMYEALFEKYKSSYVYTRTWSTNLAHIGILGKFGFETVMVLKNHRGNGIDTVCFEKKNN
ncbi:MAG: GNAT family N-acetyltransferase [Clostridia bacterium]|nr:GNAT family N-acetyltransferase [Clostridia bacterium]